MVTTSERAVAIHSRCKRVVGLADSLSVRLASDFFDAMEERVENFVLNPWNQMHDAHAGRRVEWYTVVD